MTGAVDPDGFVPPPYPFDVPPEVREMAAALPGGAIDLSRGVPCDPVPTVVASALAEPGPARPYPPSVGTPELLDAVVDWCSRRIDVTLEAEQVGACVGTKELVSGLPHLLRLRNPERDTVLHPAVAYPTYAILGNHDNYWPTARRTVTAALTVSFLGEQLNWVKGAALGLAALAILTNGAGYASAARQRKPFFMALTAMILFGCIGLFYKLGLAAGATPGALVVAQSFGALSLALPFAIRSGGNILVRGVHCWLPLLCGALIASSYVAVGIAFSYGDAVVVAPIAQLSFVLTGLLAILILKEKLHSRKAISIVCAILSVLVFSNT